MSLIGLCTEILSSLILSHQDSKENGCCSGTKIYLIFGTTVSIHEKIEASLHRQQFHGFLNHQDIDLHPHTIGCNFVKHGIITIHEKIEASLHRQQFHVSSITIYLNCTNGDRSQIVSS